jgi:branched-chain amino acid transport system permease protein
VEEVAPPDASRTVAARARWAMEPGTAVRAIVIALLLAFVLFGLPGMLGVYWIKILTGVAVYSVLALGLNLLVGRVGMVSLGHYALLALGAWVAARLFFATGLPFPAVLVLAGVITCVIGTLVGLPALRLTGLDLALITLMLAGAITVVLAQTNFPNGGGGFLGHTESSLGNPAVRRPGIAESDEAYFRYTVIVAAAMFMLALLHVRSKPGRAWAAIRQSEPAALAAGVNITLYKLWVLALAALMTGVAGGLLAGNEGKLYTYQFPTRESLLLLAFVLMGGIYSLWGAVVAGLLGELAPALLDDWGAPADLLIIIAGVGILQVILTAPGGLASQVPKDLARLGRLLVGAGRSVAGKPKGAS